MADPPRLVPDPQQAGNLLAEGEWTLEHATAIEGLIRSAQRDAVDMDARAVTRLDSAGAFLLWRLANSLGFRLTIVEVQPQFQALLDQVRQICDHHVEKPRKEFGFRQMLERLGYAAEDYAREVLALVGFGGRTLLVALSALRRPSRIRLTPTMHHMEQVGLDAVPLIVLLSFMVGAVIAFLGATVLREFGAEVFVVELVGIAFLREFAVLLTAILLAGRTASAFTAQIGAMQSGEEIDAIKTLGLDPIELLVLPRVLALLLMLPLLTFIAMLAGLAGGLTVGAFNLDISPDMFLTRLQDTLSIRHFWVGLSKAPVFAVVIGLIGCLEGMQVQGTAESVGERTTSSVVQTISLVILLDALAALYFMEMDW
jgi:phospholipid/cholesterol/gamma-HCH transport system permease protein